jgi:hypothetical protein
MPHGKLREIVEEHRFAIELSQIIRHAKRADEFIDGAKWLLLYYTFDDNYVNLLSIQETTYPVQENS